ncbi:MAG: hypothetical protein KKD17_06445 [Nanoarchaeota archaeon]|nr:hypothetical protein [Nanoarchaeota archaeon]
MAMIGYTQLMKDIFDVDKTSVEALFDTLAKHKPSELRMKTLRKLAQVEEETISGLLKLAGENNTGGTYKTVNLFFTLLEKDNILYAEKRGHREYWRFTERSKDLQIFLSHSE